MPSFLAQGRLCFSPFIYMMPEWLLFQLRVREVVGSNIVPEALILFREQYVGGTLGPSVPYNFFTAARTCYCSEQKIFTRPDDCAAFLSFFNMHNDNIYNEN
jgi:hypothetical protein